MISLLHIKAFSEETDYDVLHKDNYSEGLSKGSLSS